MYCSDKCTIEYQEFKRVEKKKAEYKPKEITCKECGLKFRTEYGDKRKSFCSDKCSKRYLRRTRKAKRRANFIEAVSLSYIIKRDGGKCQICGCKVSEEYNNKDMKIPTRDHIVPVSVGGEHSKKNIQLACLECNIKKGNGSVGSQLRLFG